jgi:hypothetical protein
MAPAPSDRVREMLSKPVITPEELHGLGIFPIGRNGLYEALKRGDIQSFRVGKKIGIPTSPLRRQLGLD